MFTDEELHQLYKQFEAKLARVGEARARVIEAAVDYVHAPHDTRDSNDDHTAYRQLEEAVLALLRAKEAIRGGHSSGHRLGNDPEV